MLDFVVFVLIFRVALSWTTLSGQGTILIGHRGDPFYVPEHSVASYTLAMQEGVQYVEPDLQQSLDGVPVCSHNPYLSSTTNIASLSEFADKKRVATVGNITRTDWWIEDFNINELKTLRLQQSIKDPAVRNNVFDNYFQLLTFEEYLAQVANQSALLKRTFQIIPEIKHSAHYAEVNLAAGRDATYFEDTVVSLLEQYGYPCNAKYVFPTNYPIIQSFEVANLQYLHSKCNYPLLQLWEDFRPEQLTAEGMKAVAEYAVALGVAKDTIFNDTQLVERAHKANLMVSVYTLKPGQEDSTIATKFDGDDEAIYFYMFDLGVDFVFSEKAGVGISAKRRYSEQTASQTTSGDSGFRVAFWTVVVMVILSVIAFALYKKYKNNKYRQLPETMDLASPASPRPSPSPASYGV